MARSNKEINSEINQVSMPQEGTRTPSHKMDSENQRSMPPVQSVRTAEVVAGAHRKAMDKQLGIDRDSVTSSGSGCGPHFDE